MIPNAGKIFYIELEGAGKFPVLHFGMTGALRVSSMCLHVQSQILEEAGQRKKGYDLSVEWP
jgi:hypothetical protein